MTPIEPEYAPEVEYPEEFYDLPLESYALFPTIVALAALGIDRSGLLSLIKFFLFVGLGVLFNQLSRSCLCLLLVLAAVLLDKSLFFNPLIMYGAGVLLGGHLFLSYHPPAQGRLGVALGLIYSIGLIPILFPHSFLRWSIPLLLLACTAAVILLIKTRTFEVSEVAINPLHYLHPMLVPNKDNANRDRLIFYCVFFLVLGAPAWSQLVDVLNFRLAAVLHLAYMLLVPPALLSLLDIAFESVEYPDPKLALVPTGPSQAQLLAALEAERQMRSRQEILLREHHFFFGKTWDQLVSCFANNLQTILPNGSRVTANDHLIVGLSSESDGEDLRYQPVYLHRPMLHEHIHILGGTGSGKTSLAITPIVTQLIRGYAISDGNGDITTSEPEPIIIFDLKGDSAP